MKKLDDEELILALFPETTVKLQLAWNVADYDIVTGKIAGPSVSLRDEKVAAEFAALDPRERHEANRLAVANLR